MPIDKVAIYKAELKPPTGWTGDEAKNYQLAMKIPLIDLEKMGIPAYPFLVFSRDLKSCKPKDKKYIKQRIINKRSPADSSTILTPTEQKEFDKATECKFKDRNAKELTDDEIVAKGDKILRLLSKSDPVSYDTVKTLLDKIPVKSGYIKPLSPSTVQTPPGTPVVQKLIPAAGPKMIIKHDFETYQIKDTNKYFYSPYGDITGPPDLLALHIGIKSAGIRKLIAINSMSNKYVESSNIEYDLRRYLAGLPTKYVNQVRFNNALAEANKLGDVTAEHVVKSYHKISGVRRERVETLTLSQKDWLLKGRVYNPNVLTALYPPHDKRFGYELWKIWASSMQKKLDRYMSQYTETVTTTNTPEEAYSVVQNITLGAPVVQQQPLQQPLQQPQTPQPQQTPQAPQQTPQQPPPPPPGITLNTLVTSPKVRKVGEGIINKFAAEAAFVLKSPSKLKVSELLHMYSIPVGGLIDTKTYRDLSSSSRKTIAQKSIDEIEALRPSAQSELDRLDDLKGKAQFRALKPITRLAGTGLGNNPVRLVDDVGVIFEYSRQKVCSTFGADQGYECDLLYNFLKPFTDDMVEEENKRFDVSKTRKFIMVEEAGVKQIAEVTGFLNRTVSYIYCDNLKSKTNSGDIDETELDDQSVIITDASDADCELQKQNRDQVKAAAIAAAKKIAEDAAAAAAAAKKKKEDEEKAEQDRLRKEAEANQRKEDLGIELTKGKIFGPEDEFVELKVGDDVLFALKTSLNDDDKDEPKFEALRADTSGHLVKYWYVEDPDEKYGMIAVTLGGQNYHFNPQIHTGEFLISEYAGQVLADSDDNVKITITSGIVESALAAVEALHNLGYVHGDIKLENMALKGKVKLFDFGESTMSFSKKEDEIARFKAFCHKVPRGKKSLFDDPDIASKVAHKHIKGLGPKAIGDLTEKLRAKDKDITVGDLKQLLLESAKKGDYILLQDIAPEITLNTTQQKGVKDADAILFGGEAGTLSHLMSHKAPTLYGGNGGMRITPPFTQNPLISGNFGELAPLFGDISFQERYKLYDYWALSMALLHMGDKQLRPYEADPDTINDKQKLSMLLFDDKVLNNESWFSPKNKEMVFDERYKLPTDDEIIKLLSIIVKGHPNASKTKELSKDTLLDDLLDTATENENSLLRDLSETWIRGHYNLVDTQGQDYTYESAFSSDSNTEKLDGDLGTTFYGVSSELIREIFQPLYDAIETPASIRSTTQNNLRQSLFDYDSFSDAELEELNTEMEHLDDEELENLINEEMSDYNSSSDTGNSNAAFSYNSESDTGRSNVAYDSSSDTGNSNAAYSYNSESEQSAAESYNNDSYNSDSDEDK